MESDTGAGPASSRTGWDGVWTLPNLITLTRLGCIPWFLWLLFDAENRTDAALLLGALGATDWVDGWIARRFDQVSEVGKLLDPTADRLLLVVALVAMVVATMLHGINSCEGVGRGGGGIAVPPWHSARTHARQCAPLDLCRVHRFRRIGSSLP